jgi:hypothetical protein
MACRFSNPYFTASPSDEERLMRHLIVFALLATPAMLPGQTAATVAPGMSHVQVVSALGEPATSRTKDEYTYLFYQNSCGKECGMNDLVVLRRDSVVDAIFRSPNRHYTGTSSSPTEATPVRVGRRRGAPAPAVAARPLALPVAKEPAKAGVNAEAKAEVQSATPAPKPAPVEVRGTKKVVEVQGTKREVVVPGSKTESAEPVRLAPNKANDTKPSIPLNPPMINDAPSSPAPVKKPST